MSLNEKQDYIFYFAEIFLWETYMLVCSDKNKRGGVSKTVLGMEKEI